MDASTSPRETAVRLRSLGISESYASQLSRGKRAPSASLAARIWRETGIKLGPIEKADDAAAEAFASVFEGRA